MTDKHPIIVGIAISSGGIPKLPVDKVFVTADGLTGDGHNHAKHNTPLQAVCLIDEELLDIVSQEGVPLKHGTIGENLTVKGLNVQNLSLGTRLMIQGGVSLEITKVRKPCYVLDAVDVRLKEWLADRCGMYAKVLHGGVILKNAIIEKVLS